MIRAAAKNHGYVAVVVDPADYAGGARRARRQTAAPAVRAAPRASPRKAFARTAAYDAAIAGWFARDERRRDHFPALADLRRPARRDAPLRREPAPGGARSTATGEPAAGRRHRAPGCRARSSPTTTSLDTDAASSWSPSSIRASAAVAIIKHTNPCGVAVGADARRAPIARRLRCDPVSAFGGIVALNRPARRATPPTEIAKIFTEVIIAPRPATRRSPILAAQEEPAAPARRRPARSASAPALTRAHASPAGCLVQDRDAGMSPARATARS